MAQFVIPNEVRNLDIALPEHVVQEPPQDSGAGELFHSLVIPTCDGDEAIRLFGEHKDEIALVLSDMGLPKRSGWDAFRMMQKIDPNVRALFASGYLEPGQKSEVLKSGVKGFIQKPYRMNEVLKAVRETLDEKSVETSS